MNTATSIQSRRTLMPERIQRKRTKGWRMPGGAECVGGHAYNGGCGAVESWPFRSSNLHNLWRTSGSEASQWLHRVAPPTQVRRQARTKQRIPAPAPIQCASIRGRVSRRPGRHGSQGQVQPATSSRSTRGVVRSARYALLRPVWILGQAGSPVRPPKWRRRPPSAVSTVGKRLLPNTFGDVDARVPRDIPGALRELQRHQARRTPGMAVASCR